MKIKTEACILGAGAGGIGCVYRLIKNGIKTVVVDKNPDFGGTAVFCGVDGWEPGVSLDGIHLLLKDELMKMNNACHVVEGVPNANLFDPTTGNNWEKHSFKERPWGLSIPTGRSYEDTLKRCLALRGNDGPMIRFQFEPECMKNAVNNILEPYKNNLTTLFNSEYKYCKTKDGKIESIIVSGENEDIEIVADYFVDASGDIVLARNAGCEYYFGCEGKEEFGEPSANEKNENINAVTYVFRISKTKDSVHIDEIPDEYKDIDVSDWMNNCMRKINSCFVFYPNGDINVNMLPTMQGKEYFEYGDNADKVGKARVYKYWNYLQTEKNMQGYTLKTIYNAGIRESYRLKGKYVLKEQDLRNGMLSQPKIGKTIAIADHAMDIHGENGCCKELNLPYEIPLECSMTNEFDNLFVSCRGASFSHIAASSVRLTRTMLSMGEGVGEYISELILKM
ncbi:MAG: FAD-dependent oxidoreductase [Clostridia bacterium]|nr:FAD-dependent oxidoreductase [Clostridia bacterium]